MHGTDTAMTENARRKSSAKSDTTGGVGARPGRVILAVAFMIAVWLVARIVFWVGFVGSDDLFYARFAVLHDRPPLNVFEFRWLAVGLIRACVQLLGVSEFAASLPSLLGSAAVVCATASVVGWPVRLTWVTQSAVLMACLLPLDVAMASWPGATMVSAGLLASGAAMVLRSEGQWRFLGSFLLALSFSGYTITFYYVAIFCLACLVIDRRAYARPVAACVALAASLLVAELLVMALFFDDPMLRLKAVTGVVTEYHHDAVLNAQASAAAFTDPWVPVRILLFDKPFGLSMLAMVLAGAVTWRRLTAIQRTLFVTTIGYWFWLGFGSSVPWAYRPIPNSYHYFTPVSFGVAALTPGLVQEVLARRRLIAPLVVSALIVVQILCLGVSGRWGQHYDVSRELLRYTSSHPERTYLADIQTLNDMYVENGFELPANVVCLDTPAADHLLINEPLANVGPLAEPANRPRFRFEPRTIDAVLLNLDDREWYVAQPEFDAYVDAHHGEVIWTIDAKYKPVFRPLRHWFGNWPFALRTRGARVVRVAGGATPGVNPG